ncbi:MAG: hypothetical protein AAGA87_08845 [Pseudomonadota bacterium]
MAAFLTHFPYSHGVHQETSSGVRMRPLFRSLFVLSIFALLTAHLSSGILRDWLAPGVVGMIDDMLRTMLIDPLGRPLAIKVLLGLGIGATVLTYLTGRNERVHRHSTW